MPTSPHSSHSSCALLVVRMSSWSSFGVCHSKLPRSSTAHLLTFFLRFFKIFFSKPTNSPPFFSTHFAFFPSATNSPGAHSSVSRNFVGLSLSLSLSLSPLPSFSSFFLSFHSYKIVLLVCVCVCAGCHLPFISTWLVFLKS